MQTKNPPLPLWPRTGWSLDHLGHVVPELAPAETFYKQRLGYTEVHRECLAEPAIDIVFLELGSFVIELLAPRDDISVLAKFLKRRGAGMHHICYRVPSLRTELAHLKEAGITLIDKEPRQGSRGLEVAFLHPQSTFGVLIELCGQTEL